MSICKLSQRKLKYKILNMLNILKRKKKDRREPVFWSHCDCKRLQIRWLGLAQMCHPRVGHTMPNRDLSGAESMSVGLLCLGGSNQELASFPFPAARGHLTSFALGSSLCLQNPSLQPLLLSSNRLFVFHTLSFLIRILDIALNPPIQSRLVFPSQDF